MYCMKCGAKLPEGTAFCPKCGTRLTAPGAPVRKSTGRSAGVQECSEKNQLMIRIPDRGLYFIAGGKQLCFWNEQLQEVQPLTQRSEAVNLCGLGFYGGSIYYWQECQNEQSTLYGIRLYRMDPATHRAEAVWVSDEELFYHYRLNDDQHKARAILYKGAYYLLNYEEQELMRVTLPGGDWENLPLPDMRKKLPLYDWIQPRGIVDIKSAEPNFGMDYTGLAILNDEAYVSLDAAAVFTLRFPLDHPEKVTYLPKNTATAIQNSMMGGMLTAIGPRVFSCPGMVYDTAEMGLYEIRGGGQLVRLIGNTTDEVILQHKGGLWWKLGNIYYIGRIAIDLYERKWYKLSALLFDQKEHRDNPFGEVVDFVPGLNGCVYLLTPTALYLVPRDWESRAQSVKDLKQFELLQLKKLPGM